jgi:pantothenate kinase
MTAREDASVIVRAPSFDHAVQDPVLDTILISSSDRIVIVEGNYLLLDEAPWNKIAPIADERYVNKPDRFLLLARPQAKCV